jgi:hypothetical protein
VRIDSSNGKGSNREIFINQATLDSNYIGLAVYDDAYVDIDGIWAASSDHDQIWVSACNAIIVHAYQIYG